ncbi:MAG: sensor histidine kinase, partial [Gemmatimonadetes bacterium]|nr:sensor histidine kinase [Gemmatimonadota bacterium]NIR76902.1 sensor histidine kinase [Gemmatimonadota bacterium]NIT85423.1 sensor histidine kinase [Gemmatimonadota bacterium]NIU29244.1 sensor histidine kinase [Gemmatimonadota bacterium]NIU34330.1 sensor histidine kinase [Gemmatimonadota bacterium]
HVRRLGAITGDLLRFARDETDAVGPVQVNEVVARVARLLDRLLAAEGVGLELRRAEKLPPVLASGTAVETILVNLVLNAQQASPPEGVVTIETRSREGSGEVEVVVRDTGPGVPEELRHRIFEPFFTTKADSGGTGLGLAVCRTLMERQGGTIHLARTNGVGAAFVLSFPVASGRTDE